MTKEKSIYKDDLNFKETFVNTSQPKSGNSSAKPTGKPIMRQDTKDLGSVGATAGIFHQYHEFIEETLDWLIEHTIVQAQLLIQQKFSFGFIGKTFKVMFWPVKKVIVQPIGMLLNLSNHSNSQSTALFTITQAQDNAQKIAVVCGKGFTKFVIILAIKGIITVIIIIITYKITRKAITAATDYWFNRYYDEDESLAEAIEKNKKNKQYEEKEERIY